MPLGKKTLNHHVVAQAFLEHFYPKLLSQELAKNYIALCKDFLKTPSIRYFLHKEQSGKINDTFWNALIKNYDLDNNMHALVAYLKDKNQLFALRHILEALIRKAELRGDFMRCTIMTSHQANESQQAGMLNFFKAQSGKLFIPNFIVEPSLICGIKLRSPFLVAEYSVAQILRRSKKILTSE